MNRIWACFNTGQIIGFAESRNKDDAMSFSFINELNNEVVPDDAVVTLWERVPSDLRNPNLISQISFNSSTGIISGFGAEFDINDSGNPGTNGSRRTEPTTTITDQTAYDNRLV